MGYGFGGNFSGSGGHGNYSDHCHYESGNQVNSFALIVVLFILLVIVGATFYY